MKLAPRRKQRSISSLLRNVGLFVMRGIRAKARGIYPQLIIKNPGLFPGQFYNIVIPIYLSSLPPVLISAVGEDAVDSGSLPPNPNGGLISI
jgi:hypothetical protein